MAYTAQASAESRLADMTWDHWSIEADLVAGNVPSFIGSRGASHASGSNDGNFEVLRSACVHWALTKILSKVGILNDPQNPSVVRSDHSTPRGFGRLGGYQDYGFAFSETSIEINYAWRF